MSVQCNLEITLAKVELLVGGTIEGRLGPGPQEVLFCHRFTLTIYLRGNFLSQFNGGALLLMGVGAAMVLGPFVPLALQMLLDLLAVGYGVPLMRLLKEFLLGRRS